MGNSTSDIRKERDNAIKVADSQKSIVSTLARNGHNLNHEIRQVQFKLYSTLLSNFIELENDKENMDEYDIEDFFINNNDIEFDIKSFMLFFMTNAKNSFDLLTSDKCSIYISLFNDDDKNLVHTYFRDPISYAERTNIDLKYASYNINLFTPFKYIMNQQSHCTFFACDNCLSYNNFCDRNDNWQEFYNANLTVPIRARISKDKNKHHEIGFFTIDNKKGGLNNNDAINLARSYADSLYMIIYMFLINSCIKVYEDDENDENDEYISENKN